MNPFEKGITKKEGMANITDQEYFSINAISNSFLKGFDRSPAHAYTDIEETAAMRLGTFLHAYLLSQHEYSKLIKAPEIFDGLPLLNRKNKPWGDFKKQHPGKEDKIILKKEQDSFEAIREYLYDYNIIQGLNFGKIFPKCKTEISVFHYDPEYNLLKKGKLDIYYPDPEDPIIFDVKKTINSDNFEKQVNDRKLAYYRQAAFYTDIVKDLSGVEPIFYFIAIEEKEPFGINFYKIDNEYIEYGRYENKMSIEKFVTWAEYQKSLENPRIFPSWEGVRTIKKPGWLKYN